MSNPLWSYRPIKEIGCVAKSIINDLKPENHALWNSSPGIFGSINYSKKNESYTLKLDTEGFFSNSVQLSIVECPTVIFNKNEVEGILSAIEEMENAKVNVLRKKQEAADNETLKTIFPNCFKQ